MATVRFWNGNKSVIRQSYELALLDVALRAAKHSEPEVYEDLMDYPDAEDEGDIFNRDIDVCVTVAGNPKFAQGDYISVDTPLMKGLLGHRLLIIREADAEGFAAVKTAEQLKQKVFGVPDTWADAQLFRDNGFAVSEKDNLETLFQRLKQGECDYVALGANEVHSLFESFAKPLGDLAIEPFIRLYYPHALVFYVSPGKPQLAQSLVQGLEEIRLSGEFNSLFSAFCEEHMQQVNFSGRNEIRLSNSQLPEQLLPMMEDLREQVVNQLSNT